MRVIQKRLIVLLIIIRVIGAMGQNDERIIEEFREIAKGNKRNINS